MSVVVTGATGHLGRLVVQNLLDRGVPAGQIVATGRRTETLADLADRGVIVRPSDFDDPDSLAAVFAGAQKVLLVSGNAIGQRVAQHTNAIEAARAAGVELLAYTSVLNADTSMMLLAAEHQATEAVLRASGVPFVLLRNGWYHENYTAQIPVYLQTGAVFGAAGDGRVSGAARADYAAATGAVLAQDGHAGAVYELGGTESFSLAELAATVAAATGQEVGYTDLPVEAYTQALVGAGLPEPMAQTFADVDRWIAQGALHTDSGDLARLAGRPTTSLKDAVAAAVAATA